MFTSRSGGLCLSPLALPEIISAEPGFTPSHGREGGGHSLILNNLTPGQSNAPGTVVFPFGQS